MIRVHRASDTYHRMRYERIRCWLMRCILDRVARSDARAVAAPARHLLYVACRSQLGARSDDERTVVYRRLGPPAGKPANLAEPAGWSEQFVRRGLAGRRQPRTRWHSCQVGLGPGAGICADGGCSSSTAGASGWWACWAARCPCTYEPWRWTRRDLECAGHRAAGRPQHAC